MVQKRTTAGASIDRLESEFLPPLGERDTWGAPWARQLEAAWAWQEAGADTDGEACQWREPVADPHGPALTMQTIVRLNTLNVSLRERLLQITNETSNIAIAEMALREQAASSGAGASPAPLDAVQAKRLRELARAWFDLVAAAQAGMGALTGLSPRSRAADASARVAKDARPFVDRRQCVIDIGFADRRKAG